MISAIEARHLSDSNSNSHTHVVSEISRIESVIATHAKTGKKFASVPIVNKMGTDYEDCIVEIVNQLKDAGYKVTRRDDILDINWEK